MTLSLNQLPRVTGFEIWRGRSHYDGADVVAIATVQTTNRKTGDMVQTWILRTDRPPVDAIATGTDDAICGTCPHRRDDDGRRSCYVNVGQAPQAIYRTWMAGGYPRADRHDRRRIGRGRAVRLGAYGDPAMVPARIWRDLISDADGHTGYTHQWRRPFATEHRTLCMASVDSAAELADARAAGWRTFRVRAAAEPMGPGEIACPASPEGGNRAQCADCLLCRGATDRRGIVAGIAIIAHGTGATHFERRTPCSA
jgi:hypothetical protein